MSEDVLIRHLQTETIDQPRRCFFGTAAVTVAAAQLGLIASAAAQTSKASSKVPAVKPGTNTSFKSLKQINAGLLNVGYAETGPSDGPPVVLLHGWPYDIHSYVDVAPLLESKGYRVIVPYLRGYGTTRLLATDTFRIGQQSVVALDITALMDALKIQKAIIAGFDWGARSADIIAVLWPERCKGLVSVGGYLIGSPAANKMPLPPKAEFAWWYQYYFATENGLAGYGKYTHDFAELIWQQASPKWTSMTPHSIAPRPRLKTPIMLLSRSTIIAGGSASPRVSQNMTIWKSGSRKVLSFPYPRSPLKATRTGRHTRLLQRIDGSSRANMNIGI
jgi:pimeloyl-ACP methyl ester carboxylesterase